MSMASKPRVPEGLRDLMKDLTKEILKEKPTDIYDFAENYFHSRLPQKENYAVKSFEETSVKYDFSYIIKNPQRYQVPVALAYSIIPEALTSLIKDLIKAVLRQQPQNLCDFAVEYFRHMKVSTSTDKKTESREINYTTYENYFINKEHLLFTPYVKCTCGRTLGSLCENSWQREHLNSIHEIHSHESTFHSKSLLVDNNDDANNNIKKSLEINKMYSEKYLHAIYIIQRHFRRYLRRKNAAQNSNELPPQNVEVKNGFVTFKECDPTGIRMPFVPQLQINQNETDINSEDTSYTSASTAQLLSATESGRETFESNTSTNESIHTNTIIEGIKMENDEKNHPIYSNQSGIGDEQNEAMQGNDEDIDANDIKGDGGNERSTQNDLENKFNAPAESLEKPETEIASDNKTLFSEHEAKVVNKMLKKDSSRESLYSDKLDKHPADVQTDKHEEEKSFSDDKKNAEYKKLDNERNKNEMECFDKPQGHFKTTNDTVDDDVTNTTNYSKLSHDSVYKIKPDEIGGEQNDPIDANTRTKFESLEEMSQNSMSPGETGSEKAKTQNLKSDGKISIERRDEEANDKTKTLQEVTKTKLHATKEGPIKDLIGEETKENSLKINKEKRVSPTDLHNRDIITTDNNSQLDKNLEKSVAENYIEANHKEKQGNSFGMNKTVNATAEISATNDSIKYVEESQTAIDKDSVHTHEETITHTGEHTLIKKYIDLQMKKEGEEKDTSTSSIQMDNTGEKSVKEHFGTLETESSNDNFKDSNRLAKKDIELETNKESEKSLLKNIDENETQKVSATSPECKAKISDNTADIETNNKFEFDNDTSVEKIQSDKPQTESNEANDNQIDTKDNLVKENIEKTQIESNVINDMTNDKSYREENERVEGKIPQDEIHIESNRRDTESKKTNAKSIDVVDNNSNDINTESIVRQNELKVEDRDEDEDDVKTSTNDLTNKHEKSIESPIKANQTINDKADATNEDEDLQGTLSSELEKKSENTDKIKDLNFGSVSNNLQTKQLEEVKPPKESTPKKTSNRENLQVEMEEKHIEVDSTKSIKEKEPRLPESAAAAEQLNENKPICDTEADLINIKDNLIDTMNDSEKKIGQEEAIKPEGHPRDNDIENKVISHDMQFETSDPMEVNKNHEINKSAQFEKMLGKDLSIKKIENIQTQEASGKDEIEKCLSETREENSNSSTNDQKVIEMKVPNMDVKISHNDDKTLETIENFGTESEMANLKDHDKNVYKGISVELDKNHNSKDKLVEEVNVNNNSRKKDSIEEESILNSPGSSNSNQTNNVSVPVSDTINTVISITDTDIDKKTELDSVVTQLDASKSKDSYTIESSSELLDNNVIIEAEEKNNRTAEKKDNVKILKTEDDKIDTDTDNVGEVKNTKLDLESKLSQLEASKESLQKETVDNDLNTSDLAPGISQIEANESKVLHITGNNIEIKSEESNDANNEMKDKLILLKTDKEVDTDPNKNKIPYKNDDDNNAIIELESETRQVEANRGNIPHKTQNSSELLEKYSKIYSEESNNITTTEGADKLKTLKTDKEMVDIDDNNLSDNIDKDINTKNALESGVQPKGVNKIKISQRTMKSSELLESDENNISDNIDKDINTKTTLESEVQSEGANKSEILQRTLKSSELLESDKNNISDNVDKDINTKTALESEVQSEGANKSEILQRTVKSSELLESDENNISDNIDKGKNAKLSKINFDKSDNINEEVTNELENFKMDKKVIDTDPKTNDLTPEISQMDMNKDENLVKTENSLKLLEEFPKNKLEESSNINNEMADKLKNNDEITDTDPNKDETAAKFVEDKKSEVELESKTSQPGTNKSVASHRTENSSELLETVSKIKSEESNNVNDEMTDKLKILKADKEISDTDLNISNVTMKVDEDRNQTSDNESDFRNIPTTTPIENKVEKEEIKDNTEEQSSNKTIILKSKESKIMEQTISKTVSSIKETYISEVTNITKELVDNDSANNNILEENQEANTIKAEELTKKSNTKFDEDIDQSERTNEKINVASDEFQQNKNAKKSIKRQIKICEQSSSSENYEKNFEQKEETNQHTQNVSTETNSPLLNKADKKLLKSQLEESGIEIQDKMLNYNYESDTKATIVDNLKTSFIKEEQLHEKSSTSINSKSIQSYEKQLETQKDKVSDKSEIEIHVDKKQEVLDTKEQLTDLKSLRESHTISGVKEGQMASNEQKKDIDSVSEEAIRTTKQPTDSKSFTESNEDYKDDATGMKEQQIVSRNPKMDIDSNLATKEESLYSIKDDNEHKNSSTDFKEEIKNMEKEGNSSTSEVIEGSIFRDQGKAKTANNEQKINSNETSTEEHVIETAQPGNTGKVSSSSKALPSKRKTTNNNKTIEEQLQSVENLSKTEFVAYDESRNIDENRNPMKVSNKVSQVIQAISKFQDSNEDNKGISAPVGEKIASPDEYVGKHHADSNNREISDKTTTYSELKTTQSLHQDFETSDLNKQFHSESHVKGDHKDSSAELQAKANEETQISSFEKENDQRNNNSKEKLEPGNKNAHSELNENIAVYDVSKKKSPSDQKSQAKSVIQDKILVLDDHISENEKDFRKSSKPDDKYTYKNEHNLEGIGKKLADAYKVIKSSEDILDDNKNYNNEVKNNEPQVDLDVKAEKNIEETVVSSQESYQVPLEDKDETEHDGQHVHENAELVREFNATDLKVQTQSYPDDIVSSSVSDEVLSKNSSHNYPSTIINDKDQTDTPITKETENFRIASGKDIIQSKTTENADSDKQNKMESNPKLNSEDERESGAKAVVENINKDEILKINLLPRASETESRTSQEISINASNVDKNDDLNFESTGDDRSKENSSKAKLAKEENKDSADDNRVKRSIEATASTDFDCVAATKNETAPLDITDNKENSEEGVSEQYNTDEKEGHVNDEETTHNIGIQTAETHIGNQNLTVGRIRNFNQGLLGSISGQRFAETHLRSFWKEYLMNNSVPLSEYKYVENEPKQFARQEPCSNETNKTISEHNHLNREQLVAASSQIETKNETQDLSKSAPENTLCAAKDTSLPKDFGRLPKYFYGASDTAVKDNTSHAKVKAYKEPTSFVIPIGESKKDRSPKAKARTEPSHRDKVSIENNKASNLIKFNLAGLRETEPLLDAETPTKLFEDLSKFEYEIHDTDSDINDKDNNYESTSDATTPEPTLQTIIELSEPETPRPVDYLESLNNDFLANKEKMTDSANTSWTADSKDDNSFVSDEFLQTPETVDVASSAGNNNTGAGIYDLKKSHLVDRSTESQHGQLEAIARAPSPPNYDLFEEDLKANAARRIQRFYRRFMQNKSKHENTTAINQSPLESITQSKETGDEMSETFNNRSILKVNESDSNTISEVYESERESNSLESHDSVVHTKVLQQASNKNNELNETINDEKSKEERSNLGTSKSNDINEKNFNVENNHLSIKDSNDSENPRIQNSKIIVAVNDETNASLGNNRNERNVSEINSESVKYSQNIEITNDNSQINYDAKGIKLENNTTVHHQLKESAEDHIKSVLSSQNNESSHPPLDQTALSSNLEANKVETRKSNWFIGNEQIIANDPLTKTTSEISFEETEAYVELKTDSPKYLVDSNSSLESIDANNFSRCPTAPVLVGCRSSLDLANEHFNIISKDSVTVTGSAENDNTDSLPINNDMSTSIIGDPLKGKEVKLSSKKNATVLKYTDLIDQFIKSERLHSEKVNHNNPTVEIFRNIKFETPDISEISRILMDFINSQKADYNSLLPHERLEEPCIRKNVSTPCITADKEVMADGSTTTDASSVSDIDDTEDSISTKTVKLQKPDMAITKMQQRRESTTKVPMLDKPKDYNFEEPLVASIDNLDTDEEAIVLKALQREDTRESSGQSDTDVIIGSGKDGNNFSIRENIDIRIDDTFPAKGSLKRVYTIASESDAKLLLKNVTIDESIKYIEPPNYEVSSGNLSLDMETTENIRRKIMAYSLSEADSDCFDKNATNSESSSLETTTGKYDDRNVSTALVESGNSSTETESTIVSAITKIQAGARGYLIRKHLEKISIGSKSKSVLVDEPGKSSFGNAAISESLERLVQDAAAEKTETEYRTHCRTKFVDVSHKENLATSRESSLAQKRSTMLQRGVALRNNSSPDGGSSSSSSSSSNNSKNKHCSVDSKFQESDKKESLLRNHSNENTSRSKISSPASSGETAAVVRAKKIEENKMKWLAMRQNSMPVQIDSEVLRVIPKYMRKKIKSAEGEKKKNRRQVLKN